MGYSKSLFRHLKPNGWIEHVELWGDARSDDGSLLPDSPLVKWVEIFKAVGKKLEKRFFWNSSKAFKEAGLVNVGEHVVKVPIGTWAKDKDLKQWGAWNRAYLLQGLEGFGLRALTEIEGVSVILSYAVFFECILTLFIIVEIGRGTRLSGGFAPANPRPQSTFICTYVSIPCISYLIREGLLSVSLIVLLYTGKKARYVLYILIVSS